MKYMDNKTVSVPRWDYVGLMCHSAGCDVSIRMIETEKYPFIVSKYFVILQISYNLSFQMNLIFLLGSVSWRPH
jgi:hypothetical protein